MSKGFSGLFSNTKGYAIEEIARELDIRPLESTSVVWEHIEATQEYYPGTVLPKSFLVGTAVGDFWTAPNSTKHMLEALTSIKDNPMLKDTNPDLFAQFILYDYWKSVDDVVSREPVKYRRMITSGHWQLMFGKREDDANPVVYHARFLGLTEERS
jgi:hypothetical protein